jgi:RHS repeat-associated protein
VVRVGPAHPEDSGPATAYLPGGGEVVVDGTGALTERVEFTPYGETSLGGAGGRRHRLTGRDDESGLAGPGGRPYLPWLARFATVDPAGAGHGLNGYAPHPGGPVVPGTRTDLRISLEPGQPRPV